MNARSMNLQPRSMQTVDPTQDLLLQSGFTFWTITEATPDSFFDRIWEVSPRRPFHRSDAANLIPSRDRTVRCATGTGASSVVANWNRAIRTERSTAPSAIAKPAPGHTRGPAENGRNASRALAFPASLSQRSGLKSSGSAQRRVWRCRCQGDSTIWLPLLTKRFRKISSFAASRTIIGTGG